MGKQIQVRVDESMVRILERIRKEVAEDLKKQYKLDEVIIYGTLASQVAASKLNGNTVFNFKIKKTGPNKGILELL